jgi:glucose/arabinose dehydrogenase/cytochrome c5
MRRWIGGLAGAGLLLSVTGALAIVRAPSTAQPDPAAALPGAKTFNELCAGCHGVRGSGGEGPALSDEYWTHGRTDADIAKAIHDGFPPQMAAFDLPASQVKDLIAYIRAAFVATLVVDRSVASLPSGVQHSEAHDFKIEQVAKLAAPYAFVFLPDGRALVTETAAGVLRFVGKDGLAPEIVEGIPISQPLNGAPGRRILNIALHPDYARNGWIYLTIAEPDAPSRSQRMKLVRGKIKDNRWSDHQVLFECLTGEASTARMAFDRQGYLFLMMGFSANIYNGPPADAPSLDLANPNGKILRMHDDGRAPADNPFVNVKGATKQVWSYGHRQSLGLAFDTNGVLWESENGARGGDELNIIRKGANYGWPMVTWGHRYDSVPRAALPELAGVEQPVVSWAPSPALSSIAFYEGTAFPRWKGNLFVGSLKNRALYRIVLKDGRQVLQEEVLRGIDRIRDVGVGPDGGLYLLTDGGYFLRLAPAP